MRFYTSPPALSFRPQVTPCVELAPLHLTPCIEVAPEHPACAEFIAAAAPYIAGSKAIAYAYATSDYAKRFGRARQGCYVVEIKRHYADTQAQCLKVEGPFDTIEAAEAFAAALPCDWSPFSKRALAAA